MNLTDGYTKLRSLLIVYTRLGASIHGTLLRDISFLVTLVDLKLKLVELCFQYSEPLELLGLSGELLFIALRRVPIRHLLLRRLKNVKKPDSLQLVLYRLSKTVADFKGGLVSLGKTAFGSITHKFCL